MHVLSHTPTQKQVWLKHKQHHTAKVFISLSISDKRAFNQATTHFTLQSQIVYCPLHIAATSWKVQSHYLLGYSPAVAESIPEKKVHLLLLFTVLIHLWDVPIDILTKFDLLLFSRFCQMLADDVELQCEANQQISPRVNTVSDLVMFNFLGTVSHCSLCFLSSSYRGTKY